MKSILCQRKQIKILFSWSICQPLTANISKLGINSLRKVCPFNQNNKGLISWWLRKPSLLILINRPLPLKPKRVIHSAICVNEPRTVWISLRKENKMSEQIIHSKSIDNGNGATEDRFRFHVEDGVGGFAGTPEFTIQINPDSNPFNLADNKAWIYPNPTSASHTTRADSPHPHSVPIHCAPSSTPYAPFTNFPLTAPRFSRCTGCARWVHAFHPPHFRLPPRR